MGIYSTQVLWVLGEAKALASKFGRTPGGSVAIIFNQIISTLTAMKMYEESRDLKCALLYG